MDKRINVGVSDGMGVYEQETYRPLFGRRTRNPSKKAMFTIDIGYKF
ncbi:MAG: hypothetical protein ACJASL_003633 [Paraglaciecola sp.]